MVGFVGGSIAIGADNCVKEFLKVLPSFLVLADELVLGGKFLHSKVHVAVVGAQHFVECFKVVISSEGSSHLLLAEEYVYHESLNELVHTLCLNMVFIVLSTFTWHSCALSMSLRASISKYSLSSYMYNNKMLGYFL